MDRSTLKAMVDKGVLREDFLPTLLLSSRVVGIATGYGLDLPGIESRWGQDFPLLSRPALEPTQPPVKLIPGLYWG